MQGHAIEHSFKCFPGFSAFKICVGKKILKFKNYEGKLFFIDLKRLWEKEELLVSPFPNGVIRDFEIIFFLLTGTCHYGNMFG